MNIIKINKKSKQKFFKLNELVFPHLFIVSNFFLTMELATYRGFTFKYLFLNTTVIVILSILSFLIITYRELINHSIRHRMVDFVINLNKLLIFPLIFVKFLIISIDEQFYTNYLFSQYHINPNNFQLILSFNILIFFLNIIGQTEYFSKFMKSILNTKSILTLVFYISIGLFLVPQVQIVSNWGYQSSFKMMRTINYSWKERLIYLNGGEQGNGWIVIYTDFINRNVDSDGVIFIPPQMEAWQMEGNPYYMRWFLYPRKTVQVQDIVAPVPDKATYVLIDKGIWSGMTEYGWPRVHIPAEEIEEIVFFNRETNEEEIVVGQDYDPELMMYKWGVIKLKK